MPNSSRRDIFDALTSDSSMDGCDGDWRARVLGNATAGDRQFVEGEISKSQSFPDEEIRVDLIRTKKI